MIQPVELNIGAGITRIPDLTNIDIAPWADVSIDIGKERLPYDDDSVDLVFSYHTLEHVPDYLFALGEMHRVLRPGGVLLVGLPYVTLTQYHLVNPYHLHNFNEFSFDFFEPGKLLGSAAEGASDSHPIRFRKVFHRFHYMGRFGRLPARARGWCRRHMFNVVQKIDFGLVALKPGAFDATGDAQALQRRFDALLESRERYPKKA